MPRLQPALLLILAAMSFAPLPAVLPAAETAAQPEHVRQIDLIHFSHTDYGFTDHPAVCRDMQRRYLDIALDAALATRDATEDARFRWTAETTIAVDEWWQAADPERRKQFLAAVQAGQLEVTALPLNNTPFLSREQWQTMTHWLPDELWDQLRPQTAVQNDVNGFPRAGAMALLDRGVRYLFSGINSDSGGPPLARPTAFWWKMPDGRRLFVWLSLTYGEGFFFFETTEWRRGPLPLAADGRYRPPRAGDILATDDDSLRAAQERCLQRLVQLEREGYRLPVLAVSMTNMWRYDNDPPYPPLADFVASWNQRGLQPALRLVTVSQAMRDLEQAAGATAPEYTGEWTDWWANGTASAPREVAASRFAKRYLAAARSPVWGPLDPAAARTAQQLTKDLCLFDEHTWGSGLSVALPYSLDTQGQFNEKARLAWRPMALAEWLLGQQARTRLVPEGEGLYVANPAPQAFSGWASMIATCLRDDYRSLVDPQTGQRFRLYLEPGVQPWGRPEKPEDFSREDVSALFPDQSPNRHARFWIERLDGQSIRRLELSKDAVEDQPPQPEAAPKVETDEHGWPVGATWPGVGKPLFAAGWGDLVAVSVRGFAPRWKLPEIWNCGDTERREQLRRDLLETTVSQPGGPVSVEQTPHTVRYTQALEHPRLAWATRRLEIWKREARARLVVRLNRNSSFAPEILYIANPLPCDGVLPRMSSGGQPFVPFADQLTGTCRDYFGIDGWAHYAAPDGHWLWVSRDAPLVAVDGPHPLARIADPPARTGRLLAMVYNNFWYTNFVADSPGIMEFQFDLAWRERIGSDADAAGLAETLVADLVLVINPAQPEHPLFLEHLYRP